jgi:hypothetical protein
MSVLKCTRKDNGTAKSPPPPPSSMFSSQSVVVDLLIERIGFIVIYQDLYIFCKCLQKAENAVSARDLKFFPWTPSIVTPQIIILAPPPPPPPPQKKNNLGDATAQGNVRL